MIDLHVGLQGVVHEASTDDLLLSSLVFVKGWFVGEGGPWNERSEGPPQQPVELARDACGFGRLGIYNPSTPGMNLFGCR